MALLRDAKPKNVSGGYQRIFCNAELGQLMSKVQSTVISSGLDLEKMIIERVPQISKIKQVEGEAKAMQEFIQQNSPNIPYTVEGHFCAFNQEDRNAIFEGFKRKISLGKVMTGREFCELLEIHYDEIIQKRKADGLENFEYFLSELVGIPEVRQRLREMFD